MVRNRISVAGLAGVILLAALGLAAIRNASDLWAATVVSLSALMIGVGVLGCLFRRGPTRAFWAGFTLFGLGYFVAAFGFDQPQDSLVTAAIVDPLNARLNPTVSDFELSAPGVSNTAYHGTRDYCERLKATFQKGWEASGRVFADPSSLSVTPHLSTADAERAREPLRRILHAFGTLAIGGLGGLIAQYFYATRDGVGAPSET